ncbi:serine hydrolase [Loktanella sp. IMCC34160]|uniref:D-alanyl-D-alanine carboxypeptidase family protein n=1 Tax=Loktanella sp. IMCC34160 TaxID=2510646 RepID=UPI00241407AD|nr:serine hydrolase [Loktanella sp. IMCC34160]
MASRLGQAARAGLFLIVWVFLAVVTPFSVAAAPYAALVMDARTGEVLHSRNADTRLHPASLTKMMTLYIAFQAVERGEISLDTLVTVTAAAAAEPPSKLGLRAGQQIRLRYLIRAAAVKSANDAATAIGIAIEGSEAAFARRMNRTAEAMGMTRTTFRNANGLTENGHLSTARDMTILGRHVIYDYPQYYNIFSRRSADAGMATVNNTNRRFLDAYDGADGIKTGYTNAAGFNLVASAERRNVRIIATMFGGSSTAARNARVAELLDMGFARAPANARFRAPTMGPMGNPTAEVVVGSNDGEQGVAGKTIRVTGQVTASLRPVARPAPEPAAPPPELLVADADVIAEALAEVVQTAAAAPPPTDLAPTEVGVTPRARPEVVMAASQVAAPEVPPQPEVVTRVSTSGGRHWGINVGRYNSRYEAERILLRVALNEMATLDGSLRRVVQRSGGFDANFMGLTRETADLACRRLQARGMTCFMIGTD